MCQAHSVDLSKFKLSESWIFWSKVGSRGRRLLIVSHITTPRRRRSCSEIRDSGRMPGMLRLVGSALLVLGLFGCPGSGNEFVCNANTNAECLTGYTCDPLSKHCLRSCDADTDCIALQTCDVDNGVCRQSAAPSD